jgi:hypothetical protein
MSSARYSAKHLSVIKLEFDKEVRNEILLDCLLSHLSFFKRLPQSKRFEFYKLGVLKKYKPQQCIFESGTQADTMFIILKG